MNQLMNMQSLNGQGMSSAWNTNPMMSDNELLEFYIGETAAIETPFQDLDFEFEDDLEDALSELKSNKFFGSKDYIKSSAKMKMSSLWGQIMKGDGKVGSFPGMAEMAKIFLQDMNVTFDQPGDAMKPTFNGSRQKMIHGVGTTAVVKFIPKRNPFTGLFQQADYGILRMSSAQKPDSTKIAPGFGLKFLRNGIDSANLVAMFSVEGSPDFNFFAEDFTTHIGPSNSMATKALGKKFSSATDFIQSVGVSDWAMHDQNGYTVKKPVVPFSLRYEAHRDVKNLITSKYKGDFAYVDQLVSVPANSKLYDVYAMTKPKQMGGKEIMIGTIQLHGKFHKSKWADENLFFRHQRQDDDLKIHPEWEPYTARESLGGKCPFMVNNFSLW